MDAADSLKRTENALRDFISYTLEMKFGSEWIDKCGISDDRISRWKAIKDEESKKHQDRSIESRLIYYADFYDLKTILHKNWSNIFTSVFGDWKTMKVFLSELEKYRNTEAHHRELLPYQKSLVIGISGEIRSKIIRYRSMKEEKNSDDYFPRIERVSDSIGNVWTPKKKSRKAINAFDTKCRLQIGDTLSFQIAATDPYGERLIYGIKTNRKIMWQESDTLEYTITKEDVGILFIIKLQIKSKRDYHAKNGYDDRVGFQYEVLPSN